MIKFNHIKSIKTDIFSKNENTIAKGVMSVLSYCKMIMSEIINKKNTNEYNKKMIFEHMYVFYYCLKNMKIVNITSNLNVGCYIEQLNNYISAFFSDEKTTQMFNEYKKIAKDAKNAKNKDEIYFFENMIEKCIDVQKYQDIKKKINCVTNNIYEILDSNETINIENISKNYQKYFGNSNSNSDTYLLNEENYNILQKNTKDPSARKYFESLYCSKSDECLGLLEKIIVLKHGYAEKMKFSTYYEYMNRDESYTSSQIKTFMREFADKIDDRSKRETKRILKKMNEDGYKKKIEQHDFTYYKEFMSSQHDFILDDTVKIMISTVESLFKLQFKLCANGQQLWNDDIISYKIYDDKNVFLGNVYMDLKYDENKKINSPMCIHMCHDYVDIENIDHDTQIAIMANYKKNINHLDVVNIFKEIGNVLQFLFYKTQTGNMCYRDNYYLLMSKIMEHIVWEKQIMLKICKNNKKIVEHLIFTRFIDFGNSIKMRCVNANFDILIHDTVELVNVLKKTNEYDGEIIKKIYYAMYKNMFASQNDHVETNIKVINPDIILQEINGSETSIYENIIVEILSYSVFDAMKKKKAKKLLKLLSKAGTDNFKDSLKDFIKNSETDTYFNKLIDYDEIDTELNQKIKNVNMSDNSNYFGETDCENAIIIDRKMECDNDSL